MLGSANLYQPRAARLHMFALAYSVRSTIVSMLIFGVRRWKGEKVLGFGIPCQKVSCQSRYRGLWIVRSQALDLKTAGNEFTRLSHGLVVSGANFHDILTDLRVPDLGQKQKMISPSCHLHMLCAKHGYAFCHKTMNVLVAMHQR